jgi:hypothetical protein
VLEVDGEIELVRGPDVLDGVLIELEKLRIVHGP